MGIEIYRKENWDRWESGDYQRLDFLRLDPEKDRLLLGYALSHCRDVVRLSAMRRLGLSELPASPADIGDESALYSILREQARREIDYWVLKEAAFHGPEPMRCFAFCRLTGSAWGGCACGLMSGLVREDIVALCREMIEKNGPFAAEAVAWLRELPTVSDEELAAWASERTERRWDGETGYERELERWLAPAAGVDPDEDLADKICGIFDACIFRIYEEEIVSGAGPILFDAMDRFSGKMRDGLRRHPELPEEPEGAIAAVLTAGGRMTPELTPDRIRETAWSVSDRSTQHSYFLWMAYWYGIGTEENDDRALEMLEDAARRGHMYALKEIVHIYDAGKYVRRDFKRALQWQEKRMELCREAYELSEDGYTERKAYAASLKELGDLLMKEGYAKRAKQYYRRAEKLSGE